MLPWLLKQQLPTWTCLGQGRLVWIHQHLWQKNWNRSNWTETRMQCHINGKWRSCIRTNVSLVFLSARVSRHTADSCLFCTMQQCVFCTLLLSVCVCLHSLVAISQSICAHLRRLCCVHFVILPAGYISSTCLVCHSKLNSKTIQPS